MPDPIMPGAIWTPGALAGYGNGHTRMQFAVDHFTVGTDSHNVGLRGYFHFLVNKEGPPNQYAEADALTWHAGPWNTYGPGIEWERLTTGGYVRPGLSEAEPLTPDQITWGGRIIDFLAGWGIPVEHYKGPRFEASNWHGHVNHGDIDNQRSDGLTDEEWDAMTGDDMSDAQIEKYLFDRTEFGISRFDAHVEDYVFKPTTFGISRFGANLKASIAALKTWLR